MYLHTIEVITIDGGNVSLTSFQVVTPAARVRVRHRRDKIVMPDRDDDPVLGGEDYEKWDDWEDFE